MQFDGSDWQTLNTGWWSLHDAAGDLVALCDLDSNGEARVVAQWSYEPYGEVIAAEHLHPFPVQTLGHKGLFLDRLDLASNAPSSSGDSADRLVPFAHSIYHNRNRVYAPALGRFLQQDPNQTAMVVNSTLAMHGIAVSLLGPGFVNIEQQYADGFNLYQYVRSNPVRYNDPTGLFVPDPSEFITGALQSLVTDYAMNLDFDVDWAAQFDFPDDDHSRLDNSWITLSLGQGLYGAFDIEIPILGDFNPLEIFAGAKRGKRPASPKQRAARDKFGGYNIYAEKGQKAHAEYRRDMKAKGYETEYSIPGYGRADAVDFQGGVIREYKPFTPSGIARGLKQGKKYVEGMRRTHPHINWKFELDFYLP